jgi:hypothetical protein
MCRVLVRSALVAACMACMACVVYATPLPLLDSSAFTYKYEMDVAPSTLDLDSNGKPDLLDLGDAGAITYAGGIQTVATTKAVAPKDAWGSAESTNEVWAGKMTYSTGWTAELRVKVDSMDSTAGISATAGFCGGSTGSAAGAHTQLIFRPDEARWFYNASQYTTVMGVNSDDYHVFRMIQLPDQGLFDVYRDGQLVVEATSGDGIATDNMWYLDGAGNWAGTMHVDYLRFTAGAYAPVPEPSTIIMLAAGLIGLLAYAWRKRK